MLYEQYRPKSFEEIVAQDKAVKQIQTALKTGWGGRAFWLSGGSGMGKTTLARIIASQGANDFFVNEYDSADAIGVEEIEDITRSMYLSGGGGKKGRAYIINEAHGLRRQSIRVLLGVLERIPKHVVFIFTTTQAGQKGLFEAQIDAAPLLSRCTVIQLENGEKQTKAFAEHCRLVALCENLDGQPVEKYIALAKLHKNNLRAMLSAIETGNMVG
jgi:replication-associated recombination protein RarA